MTAEFLGIAYSQPHLYRFRPSHSGSTHRPFFISLASFSKPSSPVFARPPRLEILSFRVNLV